MTSFDHSVKLNGKWFKAGEPVDFPVLTPAKAEEPVEIGAEKKVEEVKVEKPTSSPKRSYTKRK